MSTTENDPLQMSGDAKAHEVAKVLSELSMRYLTFFVCALTLVVSPPTSRMIRGMFAAAHALTVLLGAAAINSPTLKFDSNAADVEYLIASSWISAVLQKKSVSLPVRV